MDMYVTTDKWFILPYKEWSLGLASQGHYLIKMVFYKDPYLVLYYSLLRYSTRADIMKWNKTDCQFCIDDDKVYPTFSPYDIIFPNISCWNHRDTYKSY